MNDTRLELLRATAQKSLLAFGVALDPKFETPHHIKLIAQKLEQVANGKIKRLIISAPPRHGKSMLSTQIFPAWYLGNNPDKNIISVSYNAGLAKDFGRHVKTNINSDIFEEVFPNVSISKDSKSNSKLTLNKSGNYYSVGVGGTLTGRGGQIILCDDLTKNDQEARSIENQNKIYEWYKSTLLTRLAPNGAIIIIMTRWSQNDLIGKLLENDQENEWGQLILPAISENDQPLWPEKFTLPDLLSIKRSMGSRAFESLYQQNPTTEDGTLIKRNDIQFHREPTHQMNEIIVSIDTSFTNNPSSDYCVMTVLGIKHQTDEIFILDVIRNKMNFIEALNHIVYLSEKYDRPQFLIEKSANGYALLCTLKNHNVKTREVTPTGSKQTRLISVAPYFESKKVFFIDPKLNMQIDECITELTSFPYSKNDDFCDSLSQGISYFMNNNRGKFLNDLLTNYDEFGNPIGYIPKIENDIRKMMWPDHDWDLEDYNSKNFKY